MYEHGPKKHSSGKLSEKSSATGEAERRNADRHSFTASAEVIELSSGARFSTRTTDLGPGGCFVDVMVPFPVGASVRVHVKKGETRFDTGGIVVYSQVGLGMGIAFGTLASDQREALDIWLAEVTGGRHHVSVADGSPRAAQQPAPKHRADQTASLVRLVRLLIGKGILTESEGSSILHDPLL
jgi:PilZ domain